MIFHPKIRIKTGKADRRGRAGGSTVTRAWHATTMWWFWFRKCKYFNSHQAFLLNFENKNRFANGWKWQKSDSNDHNFSKNRVSLYLYWRVELWFVKVSNFVSYKPSVFFKFFLCRYILKIEVNVKEVMIILHSALSDDQFEK